MNTLQINLPDSVHDALKKCAEREGVSIDHYVAEALSEKLARETQRNQTCSEENSPWTDEDNARRCELIDKHIQQTITDTERNELEVLQRRLRRHLDAVATPSPEEKPRRRTPGSAAGKIRMSPDFDAPMEEFKDYM